MRLPLLVAIALLPSMAFAGPASKPAPGPSDAEAPTWSAEDEAASPPETKPAETKPAETKPAETKPAETKPAETKPTDATPPTDATTPGDPPSKPHSAGSTAPSETTTSGPTLGDSNSLGTKSPGSKAPDDDVTVAQATPDRMRPMQKAGWWTLFGGFVFATVGGVFSGLAERQEDEAERIAAQFDENSAQPNYEDVQDEYEQIVGRGKAYAGTAIGLGVVGGALAVAGITLLAVDEARLRKGKGKGKRRARLDVRRGKLQVKF
jgi:hypothetical protein